MSFTEAAYEILKSRKKPLHTAEIYEKAVESGLLKIGNGETPKSTMWASIYLENKRKQAMGASTRFEQIGDGTWGLTEWRK